MSKQEKRGYLAALCERYAQANRAQKALILDEFCVTSKLSRKYAIRCLARLRRIEQGESCPQGQRERSLSSRSRAAPVGNSLEAGRRGVGRPPRYRADTALFEALSAIWQGANRPCSKRLVAALPVWLPHYERAHGALAEAERALLLGISAASVDRLLRATRNRERETLRGLSGTTPASEWLRGLIPVRTHHRGVDRPGLMEADTVAHCGALWRKPCRGVLLDAQLHRYLLWLDGVLRGVEQARAGRACRGGANGNPSALCALGLR